MTSGIMVVPRCRNASAMIGVLRRAFGFEREFVGNEFGRSIAQAPRGCHGGKDMAGSSQVGQFRFARF